LEFSAFFVYSLPALKWSTAAAGRITFGWNQKKLFLKTPEKPASVA
jgi:hypothetical protein